MHTAPIMKTEEDHQILWWAIGIILSISILGYVFLFSGTEIQPEVEVTEDSESLGSDLSRSANPAADIPTANPFNKTETNPFNGYRNPFERE